MRVLLHPGDEYGCGWFRLIYPGRYLAEAGHDVAVETAGQRHLGMVFKPHIRDQNHAIGEPEPIERVELPDGVDVLVIQRPSHKLLADSVPVLRRQGVAVVIDIDDDMHHVHRKNLAYLPLHPDRTRIEARYKYGAAQAKTRAALQQAQAPYPHSYENVQRACDQASLVVVSTTALLRQYAKHGRGAVIDNYLPDSYYGLPRQDSADVVWPAVLFSHPDDPQAVGNAVARLLRETDTTFSVFGEPDPELRRAFQLPRDPPTLGTVPFLDWPAAISRIGIGICPLADSTFNRGKSRLKPLELSGAGVPWIASPRLEYRRFHELGAGLLADKPADWYRLLRLLVAKPELRQDLSERGRAVAERCRLRDHLDQHWDAWRAALDYQAQPATL